MTKPRKKTQKQLLIEALLASGPHIVWPKEMKMLNQLLAKYPETDFWFWFGKTKKYASLVHALFDVNNTNIVSLAYLDWKKNNALSFRPAATKLEENKVGDDIINNSSKPKTLLDFLS